MDREDMKRANWTLHREYKDAQGRAFVEYQDSQGTIHTYSNDSLNGQLIEDDRQNQADRNISKGVLIGIIVACVGSLTAGTVYMLTRPDAPQPAAVVIPDYSKPPMSPTPQAQTQSPNVTIVNIPQSPAPPSTTNVINQPVAAPSPTTPNPPVATAPSNTTPTLSPSQVDSNLKNAAIKQLQTSFPNSQLVVEVQDTNILVTGTTETSVQLQQIRPVLSAIRGMGNITVNATVKPRM